MPSVPTAGRVPDIMPTVARDDGRPSRSQEERCDLLFVIMVLRKLLMRASCVQGRVGSTLEATRDKI